MKVDKDFVKRTMLLALGNIINEMIREKLDSSDFESIRDVYKDIEEIVDVLEQIEGIETFVLNRFIDEFLTIFFETCDLDEFYLAISKGKTLT